MRLLDTNGTAMASSSAHAVRRNNSTMLDIDDLITSALNKAYRLRSEMLTSVMNRPNLQSSRLNLENSAAAAFSSHSDAPLASQLTGDSSVPLAPIYTLGIEDSLSSSSSTDAHKEICSLDSTPEEFILRNLVGSQGDAEKDPASTEDGPAAVKKYSTDSIKEKPIQASKKSSPEKTKPVVVVPDLESIKVTVLSLHLDNSLNVIDTGKKGLKYAIVRTCRSRTYLAELSLPFPVKRNAWDIYGHKIETQEPLKFSSRIEKNGVVLFHQDLTVPVALDEADADWLDEDLVLKISVRPYRQKEATFIGSCAVKMREILKYPVFKESLPVEPAENKGLRIFGDITSTNHSFLKVRIEPNPGKNSVFRFSDEPNTAITRDPAKQKTKEPYKNNKVVQELDKLENMSHPVAEKQTVPKVVFDEVHVPAVDDEEEEFLLDGTLQYLLLCVTESKLDISSGPASFYVVCRNIKDTSQSEVCWDSVHPDFHFTQVVPLVLTKDLLTLMKEGVVVIEVWQKIGSFTNDDKLVGLVKLPLRTFYIAFSDKVLASSQAKEEFPVTSADGHFPVINPFTGQKTGMIKVLMSMGSWPQVDRLLLRDGSSSVEDEKKEDENIFTHTFEISVERASDLRLSGVSNMSGTECTLTYAFPVFESTDGGIVEDNLILKRLSTEPKPLSSDVVFSARTVEASLIGPRSAASVLLKHVAERAVSGSYGEDSLSSGITFSLWTHSMRSNLEQILLAKAHLPWKMLEKLVVEGLKCEAAVSQTFVLPLRRPTEAECGQLRVTVGYSFSALQMSKDAVVQVDSSEVPEEQEEISLLSPGHDETEPKSTSSSNQIDPHEEVLLVETLDQADPAALVSETASSSEKNVAPDTKEDDEQKPDSHPSTFTAEVLIECALHLPEVLNSITQEKTPPSCYVTVPVVSEEGEKMLRTRVVRRSCNPVWDWRKQASLDRALLLPDNRGLTFKIYHVPDDDRLEADKQGDFDKMLGTCSVDLSPISCGLTLISGWYNILDVTRRCLGQLKIAIVPEENLGTGEPLRGYFTKLLQEGVAARMNHYPYLAVNKTKPRINSAASSFSSGSCVRRLPVGSSSHGSSRVNSLQGSPHHAARCCNRDANADATNHEIMTNAAVDVDQIHETLRQQMNELASISTKLEERLANLRRTKSASDLQAYPRRRYPARHSDLLVSPVRKLTRPQRMCTCKTTHLSAVIPEDLLSRLAEVCSSPDDSKADSHELPTEATANEVPTSLSRDVLCIQSDPLLFLRQLRTDADGLSDRDLCDDATGMPKKVDEKGTEDG